MHSPHAVHLITLYPPKYAPKHIETNINNKYLHHNKYKNLYIKSTYHPDQQIFTLEDASSCVQVTNIAEFSAYFVQMAPTINTSFILQFHYGPNILDGISIQFDPQHPKHMNISYTTKNGPTRTGLIPCEWKPIAVSTTTSFADIFAQLHQQWQAHYASMHATYAHINHTHETIIPQQHNLTYQHQHIPHGHQTPISISIKHTRGTRFTRKIILHISINNVTLYHEFYQYIQQANNSAIIAHIHQHVYQHFLHHIQQHFPQYSQHSNIQALRHILHLLSDNGIIQDRLTIVNNIVEQYYND